MVEEGSILPSFGIIVGHFLFVFSPSSTSPRLAAITITSFGLVDQLSPPDVFRPLNQTLLARSLVFRGGRGVGQPIDRFGGHLAGAELTRAARLYADRSYVYQKSRWPELVALASSVLPDARTDR